MDCLVTVDIGGKAVVVGTELTLSAGDGLKRGRRRKD